MPVVGDLSWSSGLGVYVPKASSTNSLSMARVCGSCCWSIQLFPRGQCSPVRQALMGRFGLTMGRSCCGISGSPCEWSTGSWVTWCTFRAVDGQSPCAMRRRRDALLVSLSSRGSIRSRSRAWAISVAIFEPQFRPPSVSSGHAGTKELSSEVRYHLHGSVITARDVSKALHLELSRVSRWARQLRGRQLGALSPREASWSSRVPHAWALFLLMPVFGTL